MNLKQATDARRTRFVRFWPRKFGRALNEKQDFGFISDINITQNYHRYRSILFLFSRPISYLLLSLHSKYCKDVIGRTHSYMGRHEDLIMRTYHVRGKLVHVVVNIIVKENDSA
jgi:hypothetical protein